MPRHVAHLALLLALLTLSPVPVLSEEHLILGKASRDAILAIAPEWRREFDAYEPAAADLEAMAELPRGSRLNVYFGSWCGDSRTGVPHLLKILDRAAARRLKVNFYGVDRSKMEPAKVLVGVDLKRVPTFVLSNKGREIGRIVETPQTTLEHDLALLVRQAARGPARP
jgi:thiol-disulfide isomerase/thioredoxin